MKISGAMYCSGVKHVSTHHSQLGPRATQLGARSPQRTRSTSSELGGRATEHGGGTESGGKGRTPGVPQISVNKWNFSSSMTRERPKSAIMMSASSSFVRKSRFSGFKSVSRARAPCSVGGAASGVAEGAQRRVGVCSVGCAAQRSVWRVLCICVEGGRGAQFMSSQFRSVSLRYPVSGTRRLATHRGVRCRTRGCT